MIKFCIFFIFSSLLFVSASFAGNYTSDAEEPEYVFIDSEVITPYNPDDKSRESIENDSSADYDEPTGHGIPFKKRFHECLRRLCLPTVGAFEFKACSDFCRRKFSEDDE